LISEYSAVDGSSRSLVPIITNTTSVTIPSQSDAVQNSCPIHQNIRYRYRFTVENQWCLQTRYHHLAADV